MVEILNKRTMFALYWKGEFGNKLQVWPTLEELRSSGYTGLLGLRYAGATGGGRCEYHIPLERVAERIDAWVRDGADRNLISLWEMAPHERAILSGEVILSVRGWELYFSREKTPMRQALTAAPEYAHGLTALLILKATLDPASYDDLMELFETYPDSAVEFSSFETALGDCWRNTIIWEVRNY